MHADEVAFLKAIAAGDETARLVFADWLDDRGDPRGPWVRDLELWAFMVPDATDPIPALIAALSDENRHTHWGAVCALGKIGPAAVPSLVSALAHTDKNTRGCAAEALGQIGPAAAEAVSALAAVLAGADDETRGCAAEALGRSGRKRSRRYPLS